MSDLKELRRMWWSAVLTGVLSFGLMMLWIASPGGPGLALAWYVAAAGIGCVMYSVAYFAMCSYFAPELSKLVEDDSEVHGDTVTHVVRHAETGNSDMDFYIRSYAAARGTTAVAIVTGIMVSLALIFF